MKRVATVLLISAAIMGLLAVLAHAAAINAVQGWGNKLNINSTNAVLTEFSPPVSRLMIDNAGTNDLLIMVNCSSNEFLTAWTNGTLIAIQPAGSNRPPYVIQFDRPYRPIYSFWMRAQTTGVNTVYTSAY